MGDKQSKTAASQKLYRSISEVSALVDVKAHVLRYWETQFPMLRPRKNRAGSRMYRPEDIELLARIKDLLYARRYTIEGARRTLSEEKRSGRPGGKRVTVVQPAASEGSPEMTETPAVVAAVATISDRKRAAVVIEVRNALRELARELRAAGGDAAVETRLEQGGLREQPAVAPETVSAV